MSLQSVFTQLESVLKGNDMGLQRYEYQLDLDNLEEGPGRGTFDDGYHLRVIEGPVVYPELTIDPDLFIVTVELQIGTEIKNQDDRTPADIRIGTHLENLTTYLLWPHFDAWCNILEQGRSTSFTKDGARLVSSVRYEIIYQKTG